MAKVLASLVSSWDQKQAGSCVRVCVRIHSEQMPVPAEEENPQGDGVIKLWAVFESHNTRTRVSVCPKSYMLVLSDHITMSP